MAYPSQSFSQDNPTPLPTALPQNALKDAASGEGKSYHFQTDTVWGLMAVDVQDQGDHFQVKAQSGSPASGYIFKDDRKHRTLAKGSLDSAESFSFQVPQPFRGTFHLTLILDSGHDQVPVVIPLLADLKIKTDSPDASSLDAFQENSDHPYNAMVKALYGKALREYSRKDFRSALEHLKKAQELDPTQPQVQELMEKIQSPGEKGADPLGEAQESLKKGKTEEALAGVDGYLDKNPDDEAALDLKRKIKGENPRSKKPQKHNPPALKTPTTASTARNPEDQQAQADQAYNLGLESYRKGDFASAKKFWEQTLQLLPNHLQAQRNLDRLKQEHPDLP